MLKIIGGKIMVEFFKKVSITSIITSLVFAIFGIVMLINPKKQHKCLH